MTDITTTSNPSTTDTQPLTLEQRLEALPADLKAEFQRLALWVETCIGAEVAKVGGKSIHE